MLLAGASWWAVGLVRALPRGPERGVFRRHIDPEVRTTIEARVGELREKCPSAGASAQVDRIIGDWLHTPSTLLSDIAALDLSAVPALEQRTRDQDWNTRFRALSVLSKLLATGPLGYDPPANPRKSHPLRQRYVGPIMLRALEDASPRCRVVAVRAVGRLYYDDPGKVDAVRPAIWDPDASVREAAARVLVYNFKKPELVPRGLRRAVTEERE